jgi:hypothetical protein
MVTEGPLIKGPFGRASLIYTDANILLTTASSVSTTQKIFSQNNDSNKE